MGIIFIPNAHYRLMKAQLGLIEFSYTYSGPATCPYHPQNVAFPENSCMVSFQFSKYPRKLIYSLYYLLAFKILQVFYRPWIGQWTYSCAVKEASGPRAIRIKDLDGGGQRHHRTEGGLVPQLSTA